MRVECESCRELVAASFAVAGDTVRATCPACAHVMSATSAAAPAASAAPCPKCGAPRRGQAAACARCGLAAARMAEFSDVRDIAVPEPVREAWARVTAAWDEPARHDDLLRQVATHNCYAWAARRYRARGPDPVAERQLDRLRFAAEATLLASATVRPDAAVQPYRVARGILGFLIAAVVAGLLYATVIRGPFAGPSAPAAPATLTPGHPVSPSTIK
jgi:hypothetical protein